MLYGYRQDIFFRVVRRWNNLPAEVVIAGTINSFKHIIDRHFASGGELNVAMSTFNSDSEESPSTFCRASVLPARHSCG